MNEDSEDTGKIVAIRAEREPAPGIVPVTGGSAVGRYAGEFAIIVASILVAFGLDAWWESRLQVEETAAQLATLHDEFTANREDLAVLRNRLEGLRVAVVSLLPRISPGAELLPLDKLNEMMDRSFRLSVIELGTGSVQALLASGRLAMIPDPELQALLAAWPAQTAKLARQSRLLEENREEIIEYLHDKVPTLEIAQNTGQMKRYPRSDFTVNSAVVQRDMRLEGMFGNRGMMIEDTDQIVIGLMERSERIIERIDALLSASRPRRDM